MSATCSRDTNCDSDQAGPGNSGAHANSAGGGRLPANPIPGAVRGAGLSERSSRTACLLKASAKGCLHHGQVQFWGQLEASLGAFPPPYPSRDAPEATAEKQKHTSLGNVCHRLSHSCNQSKCSISPRLLQQNILH